MYCWNPVGKGCWMIATRDGDALRAARSALSPSAGGGTMTRSAVDNVLGPVAASRLAIECGPPSVPSPTQAGGQRMLPDMRTIKTPSGTSVTVEWPVLAFRLAMEHRPPPVPSPIEAGNQKTHPGVGMTGTPSGTPLAVAQTSSPARLAIEN
ncbi:unnamed protein product, partial [Laminaria digitata]